MKKIKTATAAMVLSALSFGVFAADNMTQPASDVNSPIGIAKASDVEAGSNIAPGSQSTGQSMNDAFDVHKLVAGEWSWYFNCHVWRNIYAVTACRKPDYDVPVLDHKLS